MKHFAAAWCFYLLPLKGERTRLINHWRIGFEPNGKIVSAINWTNIELIGGVMAHLQNIYIKRVAEFRKKESLGGKAMRKVFGGRIINTGTLPGATMARPS